MTQTDALGRVTRFEYDKLGRRTKRTLPLGQVETYSYNSAGNLISRRDFNAKTTTYSYDSMNRLLSKTPDPSFVSLGAVFAQPITFTYSPTGRRLTMTDPSGLTAYGYDNRDRLITKATPEGTLTYSYDSASNLLSMQSSNTNGVSVGYGYDALNRLSTVTDNAPQSPSATNPRPASGPGGTPGITTYRYDDVGNLAGYLYPNGVDTSYTYNSLNRLTNISSVNAQNTPLSSFTYELGAAGNRTAVTELSGRHVDYTYDDLYRLKSETIGLDPVTANNGAISYNYDAVGNRLSRTSTVAAIPNQTSNVDSNDRLTSDTYDANGSTTASGGRTYTYDFENRILSLNTGNPALNATFFYDGDGNRVTKTVGTGGSAVTTKFLVDTNNPTGYAQVAEEIVSTGTGPGSVQRTYVHGHSLINETQLLNSNWVVSLYEFDGHGSVRFLTDANGAIAGSYTFDAFGNLIASTGSTPNNYLYAGEQFDPSLAFYYLRARYASPGSGRFHTLDTNEGVIFTPKSLHKYLYANANPVNRIDPTGEVSVEEEEEVLIEEGDLEYLAIERAAPAVRFWTFGRIALTVGVIGVTLFQQAPSPSPSPSPAPSPSPTPGPGTQPKTKDDEFKEGVNLDTGAAVAFGMITSTYGPHPDLANVITEMHGRQMFMTGTALAEFRNTLAAAGTGEKIRSGIFLTHVTPIPDNPHPRIMAVPNPAGAKHDNREKDKIIFGTGYRYGMQTFTGDESFVNFLRSNGVELVPRAYIIKNPPPRFSGI